MQEKSALREGVAGAEQAINNGHTFLIQEAKEK